MRALPVRDAAGDRHRRPQVGVAADPLIEDDQVERAGQEAAQEIERVQAVDEGGGDGERSHLDRGTPPEFPQPPWTCARPVSRAGGGRLLAGREPAAWLLTAGRVAGRGVDRMHGRITREGYSLAMNQEASR